MPDNDPIKRLPIIQHHDLIIDQQCRTVTLSDTEISLFQKEFEVLLLLAQHPGWVLSSRQIYELIWQEEWIENSRIISNIVCQLRRKLSRPELIQTVTGYGYKFTYDVK